MCQCCVDCSKGLLDVFPEGWPLFMLPGTLENRIDLRSQACKLVIEIRLFCGIPILVQPLLLNCQIRADRITLVFSGYNLHRLPVKLVPRFIDVSLERILGCVCRPHFGIVLVGGANGSSRSALSLFGHGQRPCVNCSDDTQHFVLLCLLLLLFLVRLCVSGVCTAFGFHFLTLGGIAICAVSLTAACRRLFRVLALIRCVLSLLRFVLWILLGFVCGGLSRFLSIGVLTVGRLFLCLRLLLLGGWRLLENSFHLSNSHDA
mmetsp:Transcript_54642/g.119801  ORF Transcript_54642/g.119801 Transcript_54642/m.119801 type:complete len:261 (-) Transcript_54642:1783-2565(-)